MSRATIKIEITLGLTIKDAFIEAIRIASILNITTVFNFNGIECHGLTNGNEDKGVNEYLKASKKGSKIARS